MNREVLEKTLDLKMHILSITRLEEELKNEGEMKKCALTALLEASRGKVVCVTKNNVPCYGAITGFGFVDGLPNTPGGYGNFISHGKKGKGYPSGEKVKSCPEIAEKMLLNQPQNVMEGYNAIKIEIYNEDKECDTVAILANPNQISALVHLFNFEHYEYDNVIVPMVSGCASIFRIPFGELESKTPRAIIGNVDIGSRKHFEPEIFVFVVSNKEFKVMLSNADNCFFQTKNWEEIKRRNKGEKNV